MMSEIWPSRPSVRHPLINKPILPYKSTTIAQAIADLDCNLFIKNGAMVTTVPCNCIYIPSIVLV